MPTEKTIETVEFENIPNENTNTTTPSKSTAAPAKIHNANSSSIISIDQKTGRPDLTKYSSEQIARFTQLGNSLKTNDNTSILNYGVEVQTKLSASSDAFLSSVRSFDAGIIGENINDLLTEINYADLDYSKSPFKRMLMTIPGLKRLVVNTQKMFNRYDTISNNINGIVKKLDQGRLTIIKDNNNLQSLFEKNIETIQLLEEMIVAGFIKYEELEKEIKEMELHPEQYQDYEISDKKEFLNRLDKRLSDMQITRTITIQSLPQIRLVQNNNSTMVEKIQSTVNTVPGIWKNQIAIAVALMRQKGILEMTRKVTDTTNELLKKNSEMLKINSIEVAKQNEEGVASVEVLRQVNSDLISTLQEIQRIKEEGEAARRTVSKELENIETELKSSVLNIGSGQGKTNI